MDVHIVSQIEERETLTINIVNGPFTLGMVQFGRRDFRIPFLLRRGLLKNGVFSFALGRTLTLDRRHEGKVWCEVERRKMKQRKEKKEIS